MLKESVQMKSFSAQKWGLQTCVPLIANRSLNVASRYDSLSVKRLPYYYFCESAKGKWIFHLVPNSNVYTALAMLFLMSGALYNA